MSRGRVLVRWGGAWLLRVLCLCAVVAVAQSAVAPAPVCAQGRWRSRQIKAGQSFNRLLRQLGVSGRDCQGAERALSRVFKVARRARAGDKVRVALGRRGRLEALVYRSGRHGVYHVKRSGQGFRAGRGPLGRGALSEEVQEEVTMVGPPPWAQPPSPDTPEALRAFFAAPDQEARLAALGPLEEAHHWFSLRRALRQAWTPAPVPAGVHQRQALTTRGERAPFVVYVPQGYDASQPTALHISLHGLGGTGPGTCRLRWRRPQPGTLLVCPTHPGGAWHTPKGRRRVQAVYRQVMRDFAVDSDRVVLGGFSNGGNGTWRLGAAWPWLWAGLSPRAGVAPSDQEAREDVARLPMFILHGDRDPSISVDHPRRMVDWLVEQGRPPRYIEVEGGGHDFFSQHNPEVLAWMLEQRRAPPGGFLYHLRNSRALTRVYWVMAQGQGRLEARVQRSPLGTTIWLEATGAFSRLELFLLPGVASPDRPVQVMLNGELAYQGRPRPQVRAALEWMRLTGDLRHLAWGRLTLSPGGH